MPAGITACAKPKYGGLSNYEKEMLSSSESVGKVALVECVRTDGYDAEKGRFTTYVTPFLDGAIAYPTHFLSVYDLQDADDVGDIYERLTMNRLSGSVEETAIRMLTMECLRERFLQLSK